MYYYCSDDIIIFIFLIAGVCVGLPALLWALYVIHFHRKKGGQISAFIVLLLLNDLLELLLSFYIVSFLYSDSNKIFTLNPAPRPGHGYYHYEYNLDPGPGHRYYDYEYNLDPGPGHRYYDYEYNLDPCYKQENGYRDNVHKAVKVLWPTFKIGGLYLHQLVALQSILSLKNPTCSAHIFSPACSVNLIIILWLVLIGCQFLEFHLVLNTVLCILPLCILAVTCLRTCIGSPNHDRVPHQGVKAGSAVLIVSTLTLFAVCAPSVTVFVYVYQRKSYTDIYEDMSAFLVSIRVVSDPLLCVLVCKEKLRAQTQQACTENQSVGATVTEMT